MLSPKLEEDDIYLEEKRRAPRDNKKLETKEAPHVDKIDFLTREVVVPKKLEGDKSAQRVPECILSIGLVEAMKIVRIIL